MVKITFPDSSVREYKSGITDFNWLKVSAETVPRRFLFLSITKPGFVQTYTSDASIKLYKWDEEGKHAFWHSSAHLMAKHCRSCIRIKFGIGPALKRFIMMLIRFGCHQIRSGSLLSKSGRIDARNEAFL